MNDRATHRNFVLHRAALRCWATFFAKELLIGFATPHTGQMGYIHHFKVGLFALAMPLRILTRKITL
jgi:hypothetical protein